MGFCSQIPSLLISLSTGILVTKASSEGELGDEMVGQLFSMDRVLIMVGAALTLLGVATPLPIYIFVPLGVALIIYGRKLKDKTGEATIEEMAEAEETEGQEEIRPASHENMEFQIHRSQPQTVTEEVEEPDFEKDIQEVSEDEYDGYEDVAVPEMSPVLETEKKLPQITPNLHRKKLNMGSKIFSMRSVRRKLQRKTHISILH